MRKLIITTLAGMMLATSGGVMVAPAHAQDLRIELGPGGVRVDRDRDRRDDRRDRRDDRRGPGGCSEGRALDKAERMGLRRARIDRVGRRSIQVTGRDRYGDRRSVTFGNERGCPVY